MSEREQLREALEKWKREHVEALDIADVLAVLDQQEPRPLSTPEWEAAMPEWLRDAIWNHAMTACPDCGLAGVPQSWALVVYSGMQTMVAAAEAERDAALRQVEEDDRLIAHLTQLQAAALREAAGYEQVGWWGRVSGFRPLDYPYSAPLGYDQKPVWQVTEAADAQDLANRRVPQQPQPQETNDGEQAQVGRVPGVGREGASEGGSVDRSGRAGEPERDGSHLAGDRPGVPGAARLDARRGVESSGTPPRRQVTEGEEG